MFNNIRSVWAETALTSAIEGVVREFNKGNTVEGQRWYFKFKKEAHRQAEKENGTPTAIENRALTKIKPETADAYNDLVTRLSEPGEPLHEINEWLRTNKPEI